MNRTWILGVLGVVWGADVARADHDVARLTWGRVTNPENSLVVDLLPAYAFQRMGDPMQDSATAELEVEYGVTDRLTLAITAQADDTAPRNKLRPDRAGLEVTYRVLDAPFQLAIGGEVAPSFDGKPHTGELQTRALHRWGRVIATLGYVAEIEHGDAGWSTSHTADFGAYLAFGVNGVIGGGVAADTDGSSTIYARVGGRINDHLFLGLTTAAAMTGDAPALAVQFQLHIYFGPYYSAGLE